MPEIKLSLDDPSLALDALEVAQADARHERDTAGVAALADLRAQIERQLPKAPVEEPTEFGSEVTAADSDGNRYRLFCGGPAYGTQRWFDNDGNCYAWANLPVVEVLRVGVGEPATPPAEAVEADKAQQLRADLWKLTQQWEAIPSQLVHDLLSAYEIDAAAEPTPEQVEADLAQDEQAHTRYYAQAASAPAEGDAIEALVASFVDLIWHGIDNDKIAWHNAARDLAARVLEVGGQQPGVPVVGK